jgi:hypothetical protein
MDSLYSCVAWRLVGARSRPKSQFNQYQGAIKIQSHHFSLSSAVKAIYLDPIRKGIPKDNTRQPKTSWPFIALKARHILAQGTALGKTQSRFSHERAGYTDRT